MEPLRLSLPLRFSKHLMLEITTWFHFNCMDRLLHSRITPLNKARRQTESKMISRESWNTNFSCWERVLYVVGLTRWAQYCSSRLLVRRKYTPLISTRRIKKERAYLGAAKIYHYFSMIERCIRSPSWEQKGRIGTLSSDMMQLLHRYCLVLNSWDLRDGIRSKGVHRKR